MLVQYPNSQQSIFPVAVPYKNVTGKIRDLDDIDNYKVISYILYLAVVGG